MNSIKIFLLYPFLLGLLTLLPLNSVAEEPQWKKITDKKNIKVYRAHSENSKIKTFKGVGLLTLEDIRILPALLFDNTTLNTWMHMISRISLVESDFNRETENGIFRRFRVETLLPWPVKDRDIFVDLHITQDEEFGITASVIESPHNPPPVKGYIRVPAIHGVLSVKPVQGSKDTYFTFEMLLDPGGYIPSWILNIILSDIPYYSIKKLRRFVEQDKYIQMAKEIEIFKERPWLQKEEKNPVTEAEPNSSAQPSLISN